MQDKLPDAEDDRRRDTRHSIPGTEIKIRKHSFGGMAAYEHSIAVDFSENGLSFISTSMALDLLDKVDFILSLQGRQISGDALICHKARSDAGTRYGLLFINTSGNVTNLVDPTVFANLEINMHAERTAEQVAQQIGHSNRSLSNSRQWTMLANAVDAFVRRISEIVRSKSQTKDEYQQAIAAIRDFIKVDRDARCVSFNYLSVAGTVESAEITVHSAAETEGTTEYRIGELKSTHSVQEVIDIIGRAFVDRYRSGFGVS